MQRHRARIDSINQVREGFRRPSTVLRDNVKSTKLRELKKKEINSNKREAAAALTKQSTKSVKQEF